MWDTLETRYGKPGLLGIYTEFKRALDVQIPANTNPAPAMAKLRAHFNKLDEHDVGLSAFIQCALLVSKLPPMYDLIIQSFAQNEDMEKLSFSSM